MRSAVGLVSAADGRRHGDVLNERDAAQLLHHRRIRHVNQVVLVLAHAGLALARHHADDGEWLVVDANNLADRIDVGAEELFVDHGAEHGDLRRGRDIHGAKKAPKVAGHDRISGRSTSVPCTCVPQFMLPATTWPRVLTPGATYCTPGRSRIAIASSGVSVLALPWPMRTPPCWKLPALTMIMLVPAAWICDLDRRLRAGAERDHRDHRRDADDHAEHRQRRAHLVARQRLERDAQHHQE